MRYNASGYQRKNDRSLLRVLKAFLLQHNGGKKRTVKSKIEVYMRLLSHFYFLERTTTGKSYIKAKGKKRNENCFARCDDGEKIMNHCWCALTLMCKLYTCSLHV